MKTSWKMTSSAMIIRSFQIKCSAWAFPAGVGGKIVKMLSGPLTGAQ